MREPWIAEELLRGFVADPGLEEAILGDLAEERNERAGRPDSRPASAWYWEQVGKSVPHLLSEWWRRQSPGQAACTVGRVALVLLFAVSLAAVTFVATSAAGGEWSGVPFGADPHILAIDLLLAGAVGAAAGGLFLAWSTSRAPMCPVALLGFSWIPVTFVLSAIVPPPGSPTWFLVLFPTLLLALTLVGGGIGTILRGARHRKRDPLEEPDPRPLEEAMKKERLPYRLAVRPLLATAVILAAPLVAMQFTDEVVWTLSDFVVMGALVAGTGLIFELALIKAESTVYRAAAGIALAAGFLLIWVNLAVGIIGAQDNAANLMYAGVLAVAVGGAVGAGFEPRGMARAMVATALAHVAVGVIALMGGLGSSWHVVVLTGMFAALFMGSALLFRSAATRQSDAMAQTVG